MPIVPRAGTPLAKTTGLFQTLTLPRCPRCGIAKPFLPRAWSETAGGSFWAVHICSVCRGAILVMGNHDGAAMQECLPAPFTISSHVPERAKDYLQQAQETLSQPAGSLMLCASGMDAMLKVKGLKEGSLKARIDNAAKQHLITQDMAKWAHQVRLDANDQRHADEEAPLPTPIEAQRSLTFALALAEVLFVLPARVTRGIEETRTQPKRTGDMNPR